MWLTRTYNELRVPTKLTPLLSPGTLTLKIRIYLRAYHLGIKGDNVITRPAVSRAL